MIIEKLLEMIGVGFALGVIIFLFLFGKAHLDSSARFHKSMRKQIKKYYKCDLDSIDIIFQFVSSNLGWRNITFLKDNKPYESEVLINFQESKILKYGLREEM